MLHAARDGLGHLVGGAVIGYYPMHPGAFYRDDGKGGTARVEPPLKYLIDRARGKRKIAVIDTAPLSASLVDAVLRKGYLSVYRSESGPSDFTRLLIRPRDHIWNAPWRADPPSDTPSRGAWLVAPGDDPIAWVPDAADAAFISRVHRGRPQSGARCRRHQPGKRRDGLRGLMRSLEQELSPERGALAPAEIRTTVTAAIAAVDRALAALEALRRHG